VRGGGKDGGLELEGRGLQATPTRFDAEVGFEGQEDLGLDWRGPSCVRCGDMMRVRGRQGGEEDRNADGE
jgi:hypothetical protein